MSFPIVSWTPFVLLRFSIPNSRLLCSMPPELPVILMMIKNALCPLGVRTRHFTTFLFDRFLRLAKFFGIRVDRFQKSIPRIFSRHGDLCAVDFRESNDVSGFRNFARETPRIAPTGFKILIPPICTKILWYSVLVTLILNFWFANFYLDPTSRYLTF